MNSEWSEALARTLRELGNHPEWAERPVLVVGATAVAFHLNRLDATPSRQTRDVDLAVHMQSWDDFLVLTKPLGPPLVVSHRFTVAAVEVDLVPFGPIENPAGSISWPDDMVMNTAGLDDAMATAEDIVVDGLHLKMPSLPMLVTLKIIAWGDRRDRTTKDAIDIGDLMDAFDQSSIERLFDEHPNALEKYDFDPPLASAHVLGSQIAQQTAPVTRSALRAVLADRERLAAESKRLDYSARLDALCDGLGR